MDKFKRHIIPVASIVLFAFVVAGCQSVATTSAKLRNSEGNFEMAIDLCQQALAENPDDAEAYFQLGIAYSNLDSVSLAYDSFVKARELDPKKAKDVENNIQHNFAKHYKLGQSAFKREDFQNSVDEFELATHADPTQSLGYYNLGVSYTELAKTVDEKYYDNAIEVLDRVLELSNPSESHYINALGFTGKALASTGREDEARERFERLIEEDPTSYEVIENIGNDLLNNKNWKGAAVFLEMSADARSKIGAEDFTLYYNIGVANYSMREEDPAKIDRAIMYYEKALDVQADEPQTIFNIEVAYVAKRDWRSAIDWGEKFVSISPNDPKGWQLLARCYSEAGEKQKATEALSRFETLQQGG
ncbi:MAG: tetratricopeptide repeat protein [Candidatus Krumholzibacteria bacterium]|nr:tetratricopeptide repeat protein [Candidatus Krumholzibacteria bacterium]